MKRLRPIHDPPVLPKHPERVCWGCDKYCPADDLACGNGTIRTMHPVELFGEDWLRVDRARPRRAVSDGPRTCSGEPSPSSGGRA